VSVWGANVQAAGLGPIVVQSRLGQPLLASVPLRDVAGQEVGAQCVNARIEPSGGGARFTTRAAVTRNGDVVSIQLATRESVSDPTINISLTVACNLGVKRDYQVLLDPELALPTIEKRQADAVVAGAPGQPVSAAKSKPRQPAAVGTVTAKAAPVPDAAPAPTTIAMPVGLSTRLQPKPDEAQSVLKLLTDGNEQARPALGLKLSFALSPPAAEGDPKKLVMLQEEQRRFAAVLRDEDLIADAEIALKAARVQAAASQAEVASLKLQNQSDLASAEAERKKLYSGTWITVLLLIVAGCAAGIVTLARRIAAIKKEQRIDAWSRAVAEDHSLIVEQAYSSVGPDDGLDEPTTPLRVVEHEGVAPADEAPAQAAPETQPAAPFRYSARSVMPAAAPGSTGEAHRLKVNEISDAMQLAEAWMSFHHPYKVLEILEPFKDVEQPESPIPWICLLDVHRVMGDREKYEAILKRIKKIYNVKMLPWDVRFGEEPLKTLSDFPHIVDRIFDLWDSDQIVPYLDSLLHDQRDGEREGFDLPVYRNILQLISLASEPNAAQRHHHMTHGQAYDILFCPAVPMAGSEESGLADGAVRQAATPELRERIASQEEHHPAHDVTLRPGTGAQGVVLEKPVAPQAPAAPARVAPSQAAPVAVRMPGQAGDDEMSDVTIKLHLALAYQDIGDQEGARILIEEVIRNGNPEQVLKARLLLTKLN
jgi:FimV-like protein